MQLLRRFSFYRRKKAAAAAAEPGVAGAAPQPRLDEVKSPPDSEQQNSVELAIGTENTIE